MPILKNTEPRATESVVIGQVVTVQNKGATLAALVVSVNADGSANLQVFNQVQADRDNPATFFKDCVPVSDLTPVTAPAPLP